jgi:hypothetical protein
LSEAPELDERRAAGFFGRHATREVRLGLHLDVGAELVIELVVEAAGTAQGADAGEEDAMPGHTVLTCGKCEGSKSAFTWV